METQSQALHPSAAKLARDDEDVRDDMAYFRKLGIPYEPKSLIEVLTRHKPKSAMPIACHSLADMRAKEAIPVLKSWPTSRFKTSRPLPFWQLLDSAERMRLRGWLSA